MFTTKRAVSWAFYDLANTIYSAAVVTVFLPLYVNSLTHLNVLMGAAATVAMILAGLFSPALGAVTDATGRTKRYLIIATIICCLAVFFIALPLPLAGILTFFVVAHFFYHLSLVYYNSLLPVVAPPERQGWVSGLGVGLGYAGVLVALPIGYWVEKNFGTRFVFPAVALSFLAGTIPLALFVPERAVEHPQKFQWRLVGLELKEVFQTLRSLPRHPNIFFFLVGNFFVMEAVNAVILWLSVFIKFSFKLTQGQLILVLVAANLSACVFGFVIGFFTDRIGALKATIASALALFGALLFLMFSHNPFLALGALLIFGSLGLAGTWVAGRRVLIELSPPEKLGEFFGLYGMTSKLACFSMALFALLADRFGFRMAILELLAVLAIGLVFLTKVPGTFVPR
ncbi:MAG: MFS transporter [Candidatus Omnitrophica bacterium]|nr:MFS transporter [Candidatus Omnitrophota bacterium]